MSSLSSMHFLIVQSEESGTQESDNDGQSRVMMGMMIGSNASVPPTTNAEESILWKQVDIEQCDGAEGVGVESGDHPATHVVVEIHNEAEPSLQKRRWGRGERDEERSKSLYWTRARQRASMDAKKRVLRPRRNG